MGDDGEVSKDAEAVRGPRPDLPPPPRSGSFDRLLTVVLLAVGACGAAATVIILFASAQLRVDPATVPAGRVYWTYVTGGRAASYVSCPSPWQWFQGDHDELCRSTVANSAAAWAPAIVLLVLFVALALLFHLRGRHAGRRSDETVSLGPRFSRAAVAILGVPAIVLLAATASESAATAIAVVTIACIAGAVGLECASAIGDRISARRQDRPAALVVPATTDLEPLPNRWMWVLPRPLVIEGHQPVSQIRAALATGASDVAAGRRHSTSWMATEPLGRDTHLTLAEPIPQGRGLFTFVYIDGVLIDRPNGAVFQGWTRRHPFTILLGNLFTILALTVGISWLRVALPAGDIGLAFAGIGALGVGMGFLVAGEHRTARRLGRGVDALATAMGGEPTCPRHRQPWPGPRRRTPEERLVRSAELGLPLLPVEPATAAHLLVILSTFVLVVVPCLVALRQAFS